MRKLIVIGGFSGAGKGSVIDRLLTCCPNEIEIIRTCTTREKRAENEKKYDFLSRQEFEQKQKVGFFLETNLYAGNYYGTPAHNIEAMEKEIGILEMDARGLQNLLISPVAKGMDITSIFVAVYPAELCRRLLCRGSETLDTIKKRLTEADVQSGYLSFYDYILVNEDLETAVSDLRSIIFGNACERLKNDVFELPMFKKEMQELLPELETASTITDLQEKLAIYFHR